MLEINAFTDGSCLGNPGVGGYAAILQAKGEERQCAGYEKNDTTNNRMELTAVIKVLEWCNKVQKQPCHVTFFTDSKYLCDCYGMKYSQLVSPSRANHDLWLEFVKANVDGRHEIDFVKVKGHNGHPINERVDKLAKAQAKKARHERYGY